MYFSMVDKTLCKDTIYFVISDCSPVNMLERFPFYETNTTKFPGKPGSFVDDASYRQHSNGHWYPAVNLSFTTPQNGKLN